MVAAAVTVAGLQGTQSTAPVQGSGQVNHLHPDHGVISGFNGLNPDQRLDRSLDLPGMRGVLVGNIAARQGVHYNVADPASPKHIMLVTDYTFTVGQFFGHQPAPYPAAASITLRVPGGSLNGVTEVVDDAPAITAGEAFVFVRDQGSIAGGNTGTVLVASSTADVFDVASGTVVGQGYFSRFSEPEATFIAHFSRP